MEHRKTPVVISLYSFQYLSVINYDQRFKREYARETPPGSAKSAFWKPRRFGGSCREKRYCQVDTLPNPGVETRSTVWKPKPKLMTIVYSLSPSFYAQKSRYTNINFDATQKRLIRVRINLVFLVYCLSSFKRFITIPTVS